MVKVSVIFPMYNVEKYVKRSLISVLNQTYRDYEVVAVNDGSTDKTEEVFQRVLEEHKTDIRVKLINKENGGLSDARNAALAAAEGEWVVFIDSDDVINPRYLEVLIADSEKFGADLSIGSYKRVDTDSLEDFSPVEEGSVIDKQTLMKMMLSRSKFDAYCGCFLVKRQMLQEHGISFNKKVKFSVDQAFMWNLVDVAQRITVNYSPIYNYYVREGSIMTSSKIDQICSGLEHYTNIISSLKNLPFSSEAVINRWKLGILHSAAKLGSLDQFLEVSKRFSINYWSCLRVPLLKIKIFAMIGLISKPLLYKLFRNH